MQNTGMNLILDLVAGILRGLAKVALIVLTGAFLLAVLCVGLLVVLVTAARYLLTGRKPAVFTTFTRFSQAAEQFRPGRRPAPGAGAYPDNGDVVDVQAHEVRPANPVLGTAPQAKATD